jgi:hypothetical protein
MRVVVFDRTCPRLGRVWAAGARLYRTLGWIDEARGVATWREAIAWLAERPREIDELQYWGHGKWGTLLVDRVATSVADIAPLRAQLAPGALMWLRTCESFGADAGLDFAMRLADTLGARVAGHTFVIGYRQSGLHALAPGTRASWPADEGLAEGSPDAPTRARGSSWRAPRTITALTPRLPAWA